MSRRGFEVNASQTLMIIVEAGTNWRQPYNNSRIFVSVNANASKVKSVLIANISQAHFE
jgi:hypothetical protein